MVITYYVKLFRTGADRQNGILMYFLLLAPETINAWRYITISMIKVIEICDDKR